ncbi:MAG: glycoside hydrolase family 5 protein [Formivibrio sp.]|nr:glycoside hydrolase family 5 protein [Formivibrio sp.]
MLVAAPAWADCSNKAPLVGVNLAGAEFASNKLPGTVNVDYVYPDPVDMRLFHSQGMNTFRLPVLWERLQPRLFAELNQAELQQIKKVISTARELDACVVLDIHNYAKYRDQVIGSAAVPEAAFLDLWTRLATQFSGENGLAFDLMNEPAAMKIADWTKLAQRAVVEIRKTGSKNLVLVSGGRWSGAHEWSKPFDGLSNAEALANFHDPARNYAIEVHQYADTDFSGTKTECVNPQRLETIMAEISSWSVKYKQPLFLGEFGTSNSQACLVALGAIIAPMKSKTVWRGWTYWASGRWWGNYPLSIQPGVNGEMMPQMKVLSTIL